MDRVPVDSRALAEVGYDEKTQTLEAQFPNGDVYQYHGVSRATIDDMNAASSVGSYFFSHIRNVFRGVKV